MIQSDSDRGIDRDGQSAAATFEDDCRNAAIAPMVFQVAFYRDDKPVAEIYLATASARDSELRERFDIDSDNDPFARRSAPNRPTGKWGAVAGTDEDLKKFLKGVKAPDLTSSLFNRLR